MTTIDEVAEPNAEMPAEPDEDRAGGRTRWIALVVICMAQLMVVLDATVVNIALPAAQADLGFGDESRQWIVTSYALAFGSLLLVGGRVGDRMGLRRAFLVGSVGFAVASAVGGAAPSFEVLVAARAGQGVFAALLAPAALSLLTQTFPGGKDRATAFAVYGAIAGAGGGAGLLLGGALTEYASWRWTLYVNLFFAAIAVVGGVIYLAGGKAVRTATFDLPGIVTATTGLFSVVYGFSHAETDGWTNGLTLGFLAAGVALLAAFCVIETRVSSPLLPLRIVLHRNRGGSLLALFSAGAGMFGVFLFLTYYLQTVLGFSAIETGAAFMPMVVAIVVTAQIGTTVVLPRFGPRYIVGAGLLVSSAGMLLLTRIEVGSTYSTDILPWLVLFGLGVGAALAPATQSAVDGIAASDASAGSAMVSTVQQIGGSIGTALLSTVAATAASDYLTANGNSPAAAAQAAVDSYTTVFWWSSGIFAVAAVLCTLLLRNGALAPSDSDVVVVAH